ncbi:MAG: CooT family nickel-binding protein [Nitrospirae bacterium]|nr:CooT family nickel-binding protein [Nitrospirota bacterium]
MCDRIDRMICMKAIHERRRAMCEVSAYVFSDGREELYMDGVAEIRPLESGRLCLTGLSGEQRFLNARVLRIRLLEHKIILEKVNESRNVSEGRVNKEVHS